MSYWIYILAHKKGGAIYIGMTRDLSQRLYQHRCGRHSSHTQRYSIHRLVYAEEHEDIADAQVREHRLKRWRRAWKEALIESVNPDWKDLSPPLSE